MLNLYRRLLSGKSEKQNVRVNADIVSDNGRKISCREFLTMGLETTLTTFLNGVLVHQCVDSLPLVGPRTGA